MIDLSCPAAPWLGPPGGLIRVDRSHRRTGIVAVTSPCERVSVEGKVPEDATSARATTHTSSKLSPRRRPSVRLPRVVYAGVRATSRDWGIWECRRSAACLGG